MAEVRLSAQLRTEFGKGGARRTRRAGLIPAVIYGHGADPRHVAVPARDFANAIRHGGANVLLTLVVEGKDELAIPKAIQRNPIKDYYEHIDLLTVRRGEKITVEVPVTVIGDLVSGGLLVQDLQEVSVEADATNLPESIEVSIEGREIGSQIVASDLDLPAGTTLVTEPDTLVVAVQEAPTAEQLEAEMAEAADELGIVEDQPETEGDQGAAGGEPTESAEGSSDE